MKVYITLRYLYIIIVIGLQRDENPTKNRIRFNTACPLGSSIDVREFRLVLQLCDDII